MDDCLHGICMFYGFNYEGIKFDFVEPYSGMICDEG